MDPRLDSEGYPPSHARAREMAVLILRLNVDHAPLEKKWLSNFMQRDPEGSTCLGRSIEAARIDGTHPGLLSEFYTRFRELQSRSNVKQRNVWNMDEHRIALGVCANSMVLASSGKKRTYVTSSPSREWGSIIETISALGQSTRPLIVFKSSNTQSTWFPDNSPEFFYLVLCAAFRL
ncbi:hypothetical protein K3495_g7702 [Podosphaera aphanis]|nr:hypothetical protein K3495_g7702 [Podosphaera aphanis]